MIIGGNLFQATHRKVHKGMFNYDFMDKIPISERLKIFSVNLIKDILNFSYYLFWLFFDPRKFVIIDKRKIKRILVICGGAVGDIYNIIGVINAVIEKYGVKVYLLTFENNKKFVKNPEITPVSIKEAKDLIDSKKINASVLIDIARRRELVDKDLFFKLSKIPYISSSDSLKLHPKKIKRQFFPILASRKVYPVRANGPNTFLKLFSLLSLPVNKPTFYFTKEGEQFAEEFLKKNKLRKKRFVIFHPGAGKIVKAMKEGKTPAHLWPEIRWARIIDKTVSKNNAKAVITGIKLESPVTEKVYRLIKNKKRVVYAVGKIPDIESLASIVRKAKATLTIDTSMAHITTQVETPAVIMYSSDSPERIGPKDKRNIEIYHEKKAHNCRRYACKYCHEVHMKSITVDEVYSAALRLLNSRR